MWIHGGFQCALFMCPFFVWQIRAFPEVPLERVDKDHFLRLFNKWHFPHCTHAKPNSAWWAPYMVMFWVFGDKLIWIYTLALAFSGVSPWVCILTFLHLSVCICEMRTLQVVGSTGADPRKEASGWAGTQETRIPITVITCHRPLNSFEGLHWTYCTPGAEWGTEVPAVNNTVCPRRAYSLVRKRTRKQKITYHSVR